MKKGHEDNNEGEHISSETDKNLSKDFEKESISESTTTPQANDDDPKEDSTSVTTKGMEVSLASKKVNTNHQLKSNQTCLDNL